MANELCQANDEAESGDILGFDLHLPRQICLLPFDSLPLGASCTLLSTRRLLGLHVTVIILALSTHFLQALYY